MAVLTDKTFHTLYTNHQHELKIFVKRYVLCDEIAEDLVQDIFAKIWDKRDEFSLVIETRAYLFRMAKNGALDYLKKIKRVSYMPDEMIREFPRFEQALDSNLLEKEYLDFMQVQLKRLPVTSQTVFQLCRAEERSYEEVSNILKMSKNTVKHHMVASMKWLKKEVIAKLDIDGGMKVIFIFLISKFLP